jgi:DNA primase large subunit
MAFEKYSNSEIQLNIIKLFKTAFENLESITGYKKDESNLYTYLILKILLYTLNNKQIVHRVANLYSKISYDLLTDENDANIYAICKDLHLDFIYYQDPITYGVNIIKEQKEILKTNFRIYFIDYLKLSSNLKDEYRKLVNNSLFEGYVFIQKKNLIRLLQEYIRLKFDLNEIKNPKELELFKKEIFSIPEFKELYESILHEWDLKKEQFEYTSDIIYREGKDISSSFPPCLKEILLRAQDGQNLLHIERLFLVFMLHSLNYPTDKIVNIFSHLPDFDKNKTEYQVNFAKKKGYSPHSCSTLKSLNLCMAAKYKDETCLKGYFSKKYGDTRQIAHPLFYIQLKQYSASKKERDLKKSNKKI